LHQLYAIQGWTSLPWLHRLPQRTLVMAGDDDPIVPLLNARILTWRIPDARLHVVRGGGHLFLLDEPESCAEVIAGFLSGG
ncbi:MAG: alpha/beta fold hydrolase, partial [Geodermatophilaceae bacterium]